MTMLLGNGTFLLFDHISELKPIMHCFESCSRVTALSDIGLPVTYAMMVALQQSIFCYFI